VPTIPQRELRNNVSEVLRRAEGGERFTITVNGRPVAELGPPRTPPRFAAPERFREILAATPIDADWAEELRQMRDDDIGVAKDPWAP
jgi:prevent-host-death family protein